MQDRIELLKTNELLSVLDRDVLDKLAAIAEERSFNKDDILSVELVEGDDIYLIVEGEVAIGIELMAPQAGVERMKQGRGQLVGLANFIDESVGNVTETAATDLKVLAWKASQWRDICEEHPAAGYKICMGISKMLINRILYFNMNVLDNMAWGLA
jgi:CRP-like cAMP-binding protein